MWGWRGGGSWDKVGSTSDAGKLTSFSLPHLEVVSSLPPVIDLFVLLVVGAGGW